MSEFNNDLTQFERFGQKFVKVIQLYETTEPLV